MVLLLLVLTQLKHQFQLLLISVLYALGPTVTGEEDLDDKLYMRYGTRLQASEKLIGEIENTKPPSANTIENFLISIIIVAEYVEKERQTVLITPEKVTKIVSNTLDNSLALEWARLLFKLKEDCKSSFVTTPGGLSFEEAWQTTFGATILNHFKNWCRQLINLHRSVSLPCLLYTSPSPRDS